MSSLLPKKNLIVTHETPFYLHQDHTVVTTSAERSHAAIWAGGFCKKHNDFAIFHFHDHWARACHPDGIAEGAW